jgi:hypothetical protein
MKLNDLFNEDIVHYGLLGDFAGPGGSLVRDADRTLAQRNEKRVRLAFKNISQPVRLFISNVKTSDQLQEYGAITRTELYQYFPNAQEVDAVSQGTKGKITVIIAGNFVSIDEEGLPLSPWIVLHRFFHAVSAGGKKNTVINSWWHMEEQFRYIMHDILVKCYGTGDRFDREDQGEYSLRHHDLYLSLFHAIGPQRSSVEGEILRPREFFIELCTNLVYTKGLRFRPLPKTLTTSYRTVYTLKDPETGSFKDSSYGNAKLQEAVTLIKTQLPVVLNQSLGKIFVM